MSWLDAGLGRLVGLPKLRYVSLLLFLGKLGWATRPVGGWSGDSEAYGRAWGCGGRSALVDKECGGGRWETRARGNRLLSVDVSESRKGGRRKEGRSDSSASKE